MPYGSMKLKMFWLEIDLQFYVDTISSYISREYVRRTIDGEDVTPATIEEVLSFYNMATRTILDYMATTIGT